MQVQLESVRQNWSEPLSMSRRSTLASLRQVSAAQTPIEYDPSFVVVRCGDEQEIVVNTESSIQNALLYLQRKYVEHSGRLPDHVTVGRAQHGVQPRKERSRRNAIATANVAVGNDTWFLDLMMAQTPDLGRTLNLCNHDPRDRVRSYVEDRSSYILCLLRRNNQSSYILEAIPLLKRVPSELSEKIDFYIRQATPPQQQLTKLPGKRVKAVDHMISNVVKKWKPAPVSPLVESKLKVRRGSQGSSEGDSRRPSTSSTTSSERERRSSH